jgi:excisionase family DNA binding protein
MDPEPLLLRAGELATMLSISRAAAYSLVASGEIRSVRIGRRSVRVPVEAVREWIARKEK